MTSSNEKSYRHCRRVARRAASSFYWTFHLLPAEKRRAMCALYAFSRHTDDLGDSDLSADERRGQLAAWLEELQSALAGQPRGPLWPAVLDTVERFSIPHEYLLDVVRGVQMDIEPPDYETFEQLGQYCYRVASCVGLACVHIWGFQDEAVRQPAVTCGLAFQMTNILRDLNEDARRQRCYLPREDLRRFDVEPSELLEGRFDTRLAELVRFELERTERLYVESEATSRYLSVDGQRIFGMMFATYHGLLREMQRRGGDVFRGRVRLPLSRKLSIAARHAGPWVHSAWPWNRKRQVTRLRADGMRPMHGNLPTNGKLPKDVESPPTDGNLPTNGKLPP